MHDPVAVIQLDYNFCLMDFTFINWSEHLFAGFDTVEMQDSVSEGVEPLIQL